MLRLTRASKARPSDACPDDHYNVIDGGEQIGRIVWSYAARMKPKSILLKITEHASK